MERRSKYYASIGYLDSMPQNWKEILDNTHIPMFISPLHDLDIDNEGNPKKPHYHILLLYDSLKSIEQAREVFSLVNAVGCEQILSIRGYSRYLIHLDSPSKTLYEAKNVIELSGANYQSMIHLPQDRYSVIKEIIDFCITNDIDSYAELLEYAKDENESWFSTLVDSGSIAIINYLKSRNWTKHRER